MEPLGTVHLLHEDPSLLALIPERERPVAHRALTANAYRVAAGPWHPDTLLSDGQPHFGVLVLEGVLLRDVVVAHTTCGELVGH